MAEKIMECGCRVVFFVNVYAAPVEWKWDHCPRHAAADEMYEAIKSRKTYEYLKHWKRPQRSKKFWVRYERLVHSKERAALALADGKKEGNDD